MWAIARDFDDWEEEGEDPPPPDGPDEEQWL